MGLDVGDHGFVGIVFFGEGGGQGDGTCLVGGGEGAGVGDDAFDEQCGFDKHLVLALRHSLALLVGEVPCEGLDATALWGRSCDCIQLLVGLYACFGGFHPCGYTGGADDVASLWLLTWPCAPFGGVGGDEECLHEFSFVVLNPDGILVGAWTSLLLVVERHFKGLALAFLCHGWCCQEYGEHGDDESLFHNNKVIGDFFRFYFNRQWLSAPQYGAALNQDDC